MTASLVGILLMTGCSSAPVVHTVSTDSSRCSVHHIAMKEVPVIYGLQDETLIKQAEDGELILGGCLPGSPKTGYICPVDKKVYSKP